MTTGSSFHGYRIVPDGSLTRVDTVARYTLGELAQDETGNTFRYIKANEAITRGDALVSVAKDIWDTFVVVDGAVAVGDNYIHIDTNVSAFLVNEWAGYYVSQACATGLGKGYRIKSHAAIGATSEVDIILDSTSEEIIDDGTALLIFNPFLMELVDGVGENVKAVASVSIASGSFGWVQVAGHVPALKVGHSASRAIVIDEPLAPIGATPAGAMQGVAAGTPNEAEILRYISPLFACQAVTLNTTGFIEATMMRTF